MYSTHVYRVVPRQRQGDALCDCLDMGLQKDRVGAPADVAVDVVVVVMLLLPSLFSIEIPSRVSPQEVVRQGRSLLSSLHSLSPRSLLHHLNLDLGLCVERERAKRGFPSLVWLWKPTEGPQANHP